MLPPRDSVFSFFLEEAEEHLSVLEAGLLQLEKNFDSFPDLPARLFRAAHTLKGAANLVKLTAVGAIVHEIEDILEAVNRGSLRLSRSDTEVMLTSFDRIRALIRRRSQNLPDDEDLKCQTLSQLRGVSSAAPADGEPAQQPIDINSVPETVAEQSVEEQDSVSGIASSHTVRVEIGRIEDLVGLVGEFTLLKNRMVDRSQTLETMRGEMSLAGERIVATVEDYAENNEYSCAPRSLQRASGGPAKFNAMEFDRYDELNLFAKKIREMVCDLNSAFQAATGHVGGMTQDVLALDQVARQMREAISQSRTVSADTLFQKFNRTVRQLSASFEKSVELEITGGEILLDRVIADGLFEPLVHIIRNAMAHGIEPPEIRKAGNKPEVATLRLSAQRYGNSVEIAVSDDGRGIDPGRVHERALAVGLVEQDQHLSESELIQLIFHPGFSTNASADQASGRGIGMSVVVDRLAALNGSIGVETQHGQGTTFRMLLPLSLVVVNVIKFDVAGQSFALPSALADEIVDLKYLPTSEGVCRRIERAERVDLGALFKLSCETAEPRFGILIGGESDPLLLLVDQLSGQEDTVIRPFGRFVGQHPFFSGSSLAGDGILRLVVNPARLFYRTPAVKDSPFLEEASRGINPPQILVVDDSLSVRRYVSQLLELNGFRVLTAANGSDALEIIEQERIDSVITDLEMPGMHGYDLLVELGGGREPTIPVAVLSSRSGEQHRAKAIALGATDYLVKPFLDEHLIAVVRKHLDIDEQA